ncbi:MAG: hypothetical protein IT211_05125 [Armatimonadetes bacterium]|nr:hypothetical protein [Armatimonadota bacterium]
MSERTAIAAIVAVGLLMRLGAMLAPLGWQLQHLLPDDAFYYFTVTRNIAQGNGITFDGLQHTNGFHPLWMGAIAPLWGLLPGEILPIRGVLLLCGMLDLATVFLLCRLGLLLCWRRSLRLGIPAVHAASPLLIAHFGTMNGLETSATVMLLSLLIYFYLRLLLGNNSRDWKWLGLSAGLALLARVDTLLVIAPLLLHLAWSLRPGWQRVTWMVMVPTVLIAPWILWSLAAFGTVQQSSGQALQFMATQFLWSDSPSVWEWLGRVADNLAAVLRTIPIPFLGKPLLLFCWGAVGAMVGWSLLSLRRSKRPSSAGSAAFNSGWCVLALCAGALLFVVAHTIYGGVMRSWYCTVLYPSVVVVLGIGINRLLQVRALGRAGAWHPAIPTVAVAALLGLGFWNGWGREGGENLKYQGAMKVRQMIASMPDSLRPTAIGAWNAGVVGYFLPTTTVVNLDGVLSHRAIAAAAERKLAEYAAANRVTLLIDDPETLRVWAPYWRNGCKNIGDELSDVDTVTEGGC